MRLATLILGVSTAAGISLNITAIGAANGEPESTLECWQFSPFASSSTPGTVGALNLFMGDMANTTYTVLPPRLDGGWYNAPAPHTGLIHIILPNGTDEAWIHGGRHGLIIAADTRDVSAHGHRTRYPGNAATTALQVPLRDGAAFRYDLDCCITVHA
ncbi:hypothetical protein B0T22DRAFT_481137 [Podospora appendiculata]|uniref:Uncharacterized protein n=1 Tax=Podospora appendiculata TaxID=314037 RepID=A0AAE0XCU6_9PEZI|nr:hypothetical protein B0T22DRAFT_481137 [Podospora appendiculata]